MLGLSTASKIFNKTASIVVSGGQSAFNNMTSGSNTGNSLNESDSTVESVTSSGTAMSAMKTLTQDLSSTARSIGSMKWTKQ